MWDYYHQRLLNGEAFVFDDRVRLEVPPFAEDARQVPIQIDASAYRGKVKRILAWAELNPIPRILDFTPGAELEPSLAIRIRVEQATPIRAAVLTDDGVWHIGSARVEAAGGGCTAPSVVRAEAGWEERLGQVLGRIELFPAVSENPTLTFDLRGDQQAEVWLRDNNGNEFQAVF